MVFDWVTTIAAEPLLQGGRLGYDEVFRGGAALQGGSAIVVRVGPHAKAPPTAEHRDIAAPTVSYSSLHSWCLVIGIFLDLLQGQCAKVGPCLVAAMPLDDAFEGLGQ